MSDVKKNGGKADRTDAAPGKDKMVSRRRMLALMGLTATAAYAAPTLLTVKQARASGGSGDGSRGGSRGRSGRRSWRRGSGGRGSNGRGPQSLGSFGRSLGQAMFGR